MEHLQTDYITIKYYNYCHKCNKLANGCTDFGGSTFFFYSKNFSGSFSVITLKKQNCALNYSSQLTPKGTNAW